MSGDSARAGASRQDDASDACRLVANMIPDTALAFNDFDWKSISRLSTPFSPRGIGICRLR
jgi:hypothetical protein